MHGRPSGAARTPGPELISRAPRGPSLKLSHAQAARGGPAWALRAGPDLRRRPGSPWEGDTGRGSVGPPMLRDCHPPPPQSQGVAGRGATTLGYWGEHQIGVGGSVSPSCPQTSNGQGRVTPAPPPHTMHPFHRRQVLAQRVRAGPEPPRHRPFPGLIERLETRVGRE